MDKPSRGMVVAVVAAGEKPISAAFFVFNGIIVAVGPLVDPPFSFDPFGSVGFCRLVKDTLIAEQHGWVVGDRRRHLYRFGVGEQLYGPWAVRTPGRGGLFAQVGRFTDRAFRPVSLFG